jgi:hypothetical protein
MQCETQKESAMADYGYPPQPPPYADTYDPREHLLDPYVSFVGAFLRQVVTDAHRPIKEPSDWTEDTGRGTQGVQYDAQAFLLDRNRLAPWIELTGADVDKMQGVLLQAAGLAETPHG